MKRLFSLVASLALAIFSFNDGDVSFPLQGFTTRWYARFFSDPLLLGALRRSAIVATVSSLVAVSLGVMAAFALLRRRFVGKPAASALFFSPLVIPYLVFGISLLLLFTFVDKVLTDVAGVYRAYGTDRSSLLPSLPVAEAKRMIAAAEFGEGSMGPKVQAAVSFVGSGGERAVIASLEDATRALAGEAGTTIS